AAARIPSLVADDSEADAVLPRKPDRRHARLARVQFIPHEDLDRRSALSTTRFDVAENNLALIDKDVAERFRASGDDQRVDTGALELECEVARRERIRDEAGER